MTSPTPDKSFPNMADNTPAYDAIGGKYNIFKTLPTALLEAYNLEGALTPYFAKHPNARVLDVACGTGHYSHKLLEWGASVVYGVDVSQAMVDAANKTLTPEDKTTGRLSFHVGDVGVMGKIAGEQLFDIAVGVWLLNYAKTGAEMSTMISSISANLRDGGVFVAIVPVPADDVDAVAVRENAVAEERLRRWGMSLRFVEPLASGDGWVADIIAPGAGITFRTWHLRKTVYEQALREGGMGKIVRFDEVRMPDDQETLAGMRQGRELDWEFLCSIPSNAGVLVVEK
jgi:SAM-dependent methyltransferase